MARVKEDPLLANSARNERRPGHPEFLFFARLVRDVIVAVRCPSAAAAIPNTCQTSVSTLMHSVP